MNSCDLLAPLRGNSTNRSSSSISCWRDVVVFDRLAIRRDVAAGAVEIGFAHVERIEAELPGDDVDHALDRHHALRAAEAAERGIRHGIGLDAARIDFELGQEIGVVGVEHGAIDDADAEIGGASAARVEIEIDGADAAVGFVADRIIDCEIVPLAGHDHVGVAVEPELAGPAGYARRQGRNHRPLRRLRFLAAETAAHAAHLAVTNRSGTPRTRATMCCTSLGCWVEE